MSRILMFTSSALLASLAACGGDDGGAEPGADARPSTPDAASSTPDARPDPGGVASNLPGLDWQATTASLPGLEIVSSNLVQENLGAGSVYQNWYAELRNTGTKTICYPEVTLELKDAGGRVLVEMYSFADTAPYKASSTVSTSCLAPGATAVVWDIQNPPSEAALGQIRSASYTIEGLEIATARPHPLAPTMTGTVYERNPGYWAVEGTVRGGTGAIRNIGVDVYPVGPEGWVLDDLGDTNLGSIPAGGSWSYDTTAYRGARFSSYHQFVSFIEGASAAPAAAVAPAVAAADQATERERADRNALRATRDALRASLR
jgi:hypothetical protein